MSHEMELPPGLHTRGKTFWVETMAEYELTGDSAALLLELCRTLDLIASLDALVATDGTMVEGSRGQAILHPALVEARAQRLVLIRLVRALDLPADEIPARTSMLGRRQVLSRRGSAGAVVALRAGASG